MNRDAMRAWLDEPGKTWRWNQGEADGYEAVELRGKRLRWYRWSHAFEGGGAVDEVLQPTASFLRDGPPRPVPARVREALERAISASA
ncbi:MAG: hypothetical protein AAF938_14675 [Myxococcota bacterium]